MFIHNVDNLLQADVVNNILAQNHYMSSNYYQLALCFTTPVAILCVCVSMYTRKDLKSKCSCFQYLLFSNQEIIDFCQCAGITHCLTAKYPIAISKKVIEICFV